MYPRQQWFCRRAYTSNLNSAGTGSGTDSATSSAANHEQCSGHFKHHGKFFHKHVHPGG